MKKTTKGAIAAGGAAVILLGGASTLAFWTDNETVDGGDLTAGEMTLSAVTCDADWLEGTDVITAIVPGDVVTKECTGTLELVGEHIGATVDLDDDSLAAVEAVFGDEVTLTATMTEPGASVTDPGTYDVTVVISADFDESIDNDETLMNATAALDQLELTATQTHDTTP